MNSFQRLFTAGDIVGAVGHCCLLGPGKTQPVARSRRQPPLLLPCRGSGQLPSPHRALNANMRSKFSCVMSRLVGLDSDMISEILPGLGVEVLANRCFNAQGSCRRQRRVQRDRGSGRPIARMLDFSVESFL